MGDYDVFLTAKIKPEIDNEDINKLGKALNDLSSEFNPLKNITEQQKSEIQSKIDQAKGYFEEGEDASGNKVWKFISGFEQLGSGVLSELVSNLRSFGKSLIDVKDASENYAKNQKDGIKFANSYRKAMSAASVADRLSQTKLSNPEFADMFSDVKRMVSARYDVLARDEKTSLFRDTWASKMSDDRWLRKEVGLLANKRGHEVEDADVTQLIQSALYGIGPRAKIRDERPMFAPLYKSSEITGNPNDIFGNRAIRRLYERGGKLNPEAKVINDKELAYSGGLYKDIRLSQMGGNKVAQKIALETGLAQYTNKNGELELQWADNPTQDQMRLALAKAVAISRRARTGQAIFERDADLNPNMNSTFAEALDFIKLYSERANGKNGKAFIERYIDQAGLELESKVPAQFVAGPKTTKPQSTVGKIPTYAVPYTTLQEDAQGNISFVPRSKEDMHKVVTTTGQLKVNKKDMGIMLQNSQLTRAAGLDPNVSGSYGFGYDESGNAIFYDENHHPAIVAMPIEDIYERDDQGYLNKDRVLTKTGEMFQRSINERVPYQGRPMQYVYSSGESALYMDAERYDKQVQEDKKLGLGNRFFGYDPTTPEFVVEGDYGATNKHSAGAKRIGTQGNLLSDVVSNGVNFDELKFGTFSVASQKELNDYYGTKVYGTKLVDGAGLIDPRFSPFSFQARSLGEGFKGVLGNYDWRDYLRQTVRYTPGAEFSPFVKFDQNDEENGRVTNFLMPSVAFKQLNETQRRAVMARIALDSHPEYRKQFSPENIKKFQEDAAADENIGKLLFGSLLDEYFQDVMDPTLGGLAEAEMLKGHSQMTMVDVDDYVNFMKNFVTLNDEQGAKDALTEKEKRHLIETIGGKKFVRLNAQETNAHLNAAMRSSGLFVSKADEDFNTDSRWIGRQLAEGTGFSAKDRERSAELVAKRLAEMEGIDYWINKDKFSARPDIQQRFYEAEDKAAFVQEDPAALEYIQSQILGTRKKSFTHYMIPKDASYSLAFPILGSLFENAISNAGATVDTTGALAWTYIQNLQNPEFLKNQLHFTDEELKSVYKKDASGNLTTDVDIEKLLFSPQHSQKVMATRTPTAIDTATIATNLFQKGASMSSLKGGDKSLAMLMPEAINRMNTGDFDGDTIWMFSHFSDEWANGLEKFNEFAKIDEETAADIDALLKEQMEELRGKVIKGTRGERETERLYMLMQSQGEMGKASAVMRNALDLYDLNDEKDRVKFARAYRLGSKYYDYSTSEGQKQGWLGNYAEAAIKGSYNASRQFSRFQKLVADDYDVPESDRDKNQPGIFKHRLRSLNNMQDVGAAIALAKQRRDTGSDFGFSDMVGNWIQREYGVGSKGYNKALFDVANEYGNVLIGQNDLSKIYSRNELEKMFERWDKSLELEIGKTQDKDVLERLTRERNDLKSQREKIFNAGADGSYSNFALYRENIERFVKNYKTQIKDPNDKNDPNKTLMDFYNEVALLDEYFQKSDVDQISGDVNYQQRIDTNLQKFRDQRRAIETNARGTANGFVNFWTDYFKGKNPTTTQIENFIKNPTKLPVTFQRYGEDGSLIRDPAHEISPEFENTKWQRDALENDMRKAMGLPEKLQLATPFGSFLHEAFQTTLLNAEKARIESGAQNPTYTDGDFMNVVRDLWRNGKTTIDGKNMVSWKDRLMGSLGDLEDPLTEDEWNAIDKYLSSTDPNAPLEISSDHGRLAAKIKGAFTPGRNKNDFFFKQLFGKGKLFESETLTIDPNSKEARSPYGNNERVMVRDLLSGNKEDKTHFGPDMIWQMGDDDLNSDLVMYDWKPDQEGASKSIYQMINYAKQAEVNSEKVFARLSDAQKAARKARTLTDDQLKASGFTDEDIRFLKFRNDEGKFRLKTLIGKEYTNTQNDVMYDYASHPELNNLVMNQDLKTARDLWLAYRNQGGENNAGMFQAFQHMMDLGFIDPNEKAPEALRKYTGNETTFQDIADAASNFREKNRNGRRFSGRSYIKSHNEEWNFMVAKYAQNKEKLDEVTERLRSVRGKYRNRATTDAEYSQFDGLYEDLSALDDPEFIGALEAVYKDVLPTAMQDIGSFVGNRLEQKKILDTIISTAATEDPRMAAESLKRQLYGSTGTDVYQKVESVVGRANLAAGTRQTLKEPFKEKFFKANGSKADEVWAQAAELERNYQKALTENDTSETGQAATKARRDFIENELQQRYGFDKGNDKDKISSEDFMKKALLYSNAQEEIDVLRSTEKELISRLYEDDRKQINEDVLSLTGANKTPEQKAQTKIDKARQDINNYIASSNLDILEADKKAGNYINSLSSEYGENRRERLKEVVSSGNMSNLNAFIQTASGDDLGILEQIKNIMLRKSALQNAITSLNEYLNEGFDLFEEETKDQSKTQANLETTTAIAKAMSYNQFADRLFTNKPKSQSIQPEVIREPAVQPQVEQPQQPVQQQVQAPAQQLIQQPQAPVQEIVQPPVQAPVQEPVQQPVQEPVQQPAQPPIQQITPEQRQQMLNEEIAKLEASTPAATVAAITEEERKNRISERYKDIALASNGPVPAALLAAEVQKAKDELGPVSVPEVTAEARQARIDQRVKDLSVAPFVPQEIPDTNLGTHRKTEHEAWSYEDLQKTQEANAAKRAEAQRAAEEARQQSIQERQLSFDEVMSRRESLTSVPERPTEPKNYYEYKKGWLELKPVPEEPVKPSQPLGEEPKPFTERAPIVFRKEYPTAPDHYRIQKEEKEKLGLVGPEFDRYAASGSSYEEFQQKVKDEITKRGLANNSENRMRIGNELKPKLRDERIKEFDEETSREIQRMYQEGADREAQQRGIFASKNREKIANETNESIKRYREQRESEKDQMLAEYDASPLGVAEAADKELKERQRNPVLTRQAKKNADERIARERQAYKDDIEQWEKDNAEAQANSPEYQSYLQRKAQREQERKDYQNRWREHLQYNESKDERDRIIKQNQEYKEAEEYDTALSLFKKARDQRSAELRENEYALGRGTPSDVLTAIQNGTFRPEALTRLNYESMNRDFQRNVDKKKQELFDQNKDNYILQAGEAKFGKGYTDDTIYRSKIYEDLMYQRHFDAKQKLRSGYKDESILSDIKRSIERDAGQIAYQDAVSAVASELGYDPNGDIDKQIQAKAQEKTEGTVRQAIDLNRQQLEQEAARLSKEEQPQTSRPAYKLRGRYGMFARSINQGTANRIAEAERIRQENETAAAAREADIANLAVQQVDNEIKAEQDAAKAQAEQARDAEAQRRAADAIQKRSDAERTRIQAQATQEVDQEIKNETEEAQKRAIAQRSQQIKDQATANVDAKIQEMNAAQQAEQKQEEKKEEKPVQQPVQQPTQQTQQPPVSPVQQPVQQPVQPPTQTVTQTTTTTQTSTITQQTVPPTPPVPPVPPVTTEEQTEQQATSDEEARNARARAKAAQHIAQERETLSKLRQSDQSSLSDIEKAELDKLSTRLNSENVDNWANTLTGYYAQAEQNKQDLIDTQRANQLDAMQRQDALNLSQSANQFRRSQQQQMRYAFNGMIGRSLYGLQDRRENLQMRRDSMQNQLTNLKNDLSIKQTALQNYVKQNGGDEEKLKNDEEYKQLAHESATAEQRVNGLNSNLAQTQQQLSSLSGPGATVGAVFEGIGAQAMMLAKRLGRQMFQKALTEAKKFVQEFDSTMAQIQMITLKTDSQMSDLGTNLIDRAKELKVSVSEITKSAATLYRQGLSDEEVDDRLGVISKFSKVSGTKVEDATKLITVAMNTGLVTDAAKAADVVTALGDSAATNAAQIEKGIEKAGAAAAADGTTFEELTAMLTAITSTTQIGGNVAGRTLNTIFGRMNKIGTNEMIVDENGNKISGSAVAQLLGAQGISMYENGKKRSSFSVLNDLSKKWDTMSDAEQQQIANAIAGTRQYSNFAAIMQGMSEGKVDEYIDLAGGSEGTVDKKFDVYSKTLQAGLTDLKNTFDSVVNDLVDSGTFDTIIGGLKDITVGIGEIVKAAGGIGPLLLSFGALAVIMAGIRGGAPGAIAMGAIVAGLGIAVAVGSATNAAPKTKSASETYDDYAKSATSIAKQRAESISRFEELGSKKERTAEENRELLMLGSQIGSFSGASDSVNKLSDAISNLGDKAGSSASDVKKLTKEMADQARERANQENAISFIESLSASSGAGKIAEKIDTSITERNERPENRRAKVLQALSDAAAEDEQRAKAEGDKTIKFGTTQNDVLAMLISGQNNARYTVNNGVVNRNASNFKIDYAKYRDSLADTFADLSMSPLASGWIAEIAKGKTDKTYVVSEWKNILDKYASGNYSDQASYESVVINEALKLLFPSGYESKDQVKDNNDYISQLVADELTSIFQQQSEVLPFTDEMLPYVVENFKKFFLQRAKKDNNGNIIKPDDKEMQKYITDWIGIQAGQPIDFNWLTSVFKGKSEEEGWKEGISKQLENFGLEPVSSTGLYYDYDTNQWITQEDALKKMQDYETLYNEAEKNGQAKPQRPNIKGYENYLTGGTQTGYVAWQQDKKNQVALAADSVLRDLWSFRSSDEYAEYGDATEMQKLLWHAAKGKIIDWGTLAEDAEVNRILGQLGETDAKGNITASRSVQDNVMRELEAYLFKTGRDYGEQQTTLATRAQHANIALTGLLNGTLFTSAQERDVALEDWNKRREEALSKITGGKFAPSTSSESAAYRDWLAANQRPGEDFLTDLDETYLTGIIGADLTSKVKSKQATPREVALAQKKVLNALTGVNGLTSSDKLTELGNVATLLNEGKIDELKNYWTEDQEVMTEYVGGFSKLSELMSLATLDNRSEKQERDYKVLLKEFNDYVNEEQGKYNLAGLKNASEIISNREMFKTGTYADRMAQLDKWMSSSADYQEAMYNIDNRDYQSASVLASTLGIEEKTAREKLSTEEGRAELTKAVKSKTADLYKTIALSLGADNLKDFDVSAGDLGSLKTELVNALNYVEDESRAVIQSLIDNITNAGDLAAAEKESIGEAYDSAIQSLNENVNTSRGYKWFGENYSSILAPSKVENLYYDNEDDVWVSSGYRPTTLKERLDSINTEEFNTKDFIKQNPAVAAVLTAADAGMYGADASAYLDDFFLNGFVGGQKTTDYYTTSANALFNNQPGLANGVLFNNGLFNAEGISAMDANQAKQVYADISKIMQDANLSPAFGEISQQWTSLSEALVKLSTGDAAGAAKILEGINDQINSSKTQEALKYNKGISNLAQIIDDLKKGGPAAAKAALQLDKSMTDLMDKQLAFNKASGKSGKELEKSAKKGDKTLGILASASEFSEDQLKNKSAEEIQNIIDSLQPSLTQQFQESLQGLYDALPEEVINIPISDLVTINADGSIDLSDVDSEMAATAQRILASIMTLARDYGGVDLKTLIGDKDVRVIGELIKGTSLNATGKDYSNRGKGGGGGGGKSPTDKLLEQQKHRLSDINHQIKMTQIDEAHQDRMNNTSAYFDSLDREIGLQNRLGKEYQNNIAEMKAQLGSVKEGSDDWKKLTEAIWEAEEAYAAIQDTIEDVNAKRLAHIQKQQKNQDAKDDYTTSMWGIYAQRFLSEERYADYRQAIENQIGATRSAITTNNQQITELEGELGNFVEGSDEFMQIEQDIMNIKQDTAQKENEMVQLQIELDRQRLAQIATYLQRSSATGQHNINMLQTYGQAYSTAGFNDEYRKNMEDQLDDYDKLIAANREARDSAVATMNSFVTGSTVWYEARDAVYQYDEAIAQATTAQIELRRAMQELDLQMISDAYNDAIRGDEHVTKLMEDLRQSFLETKDYEAYNEATRRIINEKQELIDDAQKAAQAQRDYIANNELDIALRREAEETLNQYEETVSSLIAERDRMVRELQKNEIDQMIEKMEWRASEYEHNLKLIQYQETKYQNADELTNYGIMLRHETDLRQENADALEKEITALKAELVGLEENKEEYQKVVEQIRKKEEQLKSENTQILKNNELLEENTKKIVQVRKTLEDSIDKEIRAEKKRQRDMLNATVSMQNNIVDVIRKRYQEEWALQRRTIERQKQALTEEKALIAQRLSARKKAADEAEKYEELAELRRQLALIQADPTRTKDAKELREKIKNLEKDIAWNIADQEAAAEQEGLDNQIKALDDYVTVNEENLNEMLSDANNFVDEVGGLVTGSYEQIVLWMQQNNTAYKNSLDEAQQQMINSWEDTWKAMHNITDTYWTEVGQLMVTRDTYLDYMRSTSQEYRDANESGKFLLEKQWEDMYDKYVSSTITSDEAVNWQIHQHDLPEIISQIDKLDDIVYDIYGLIKDPYEFEKWRTYDFANKDNSTGEMPDFSVDYTGWGRTEDLSGTDSYEPSDYSGSGSGSGGGGGGSGSGKSSEKKDHGFSYVFNGTKHTKGGYAWESIAKTVALAEINDLASKISNAQVAQMEKARAISSLNTYKEGGYVDYTGPAWVDGTKQRPEAFLDAYDTESIRQMLDAFNYIRQKPMMTAIDPAFFRSGTTNTMGDLNVSINVEKLDSDADYEYIADRVGEVFQKKLQKNGFNTAAYSF